MRKGRPFFSMIFSSSVHAILRIQQSIYTPIQTADYPPKLFSLKMCQDRSCLAEVPKGPIYVQPKFVTQQRFSFTIYPLCPPPLQSPENIASNIHLMHTEIYSNLILQESASFTIFKQTWLQAIRIYNDPSHQQNINLAKRLIFPFCHISIARAR